MREIELKIKLPDTVTVHIPSLSDMKIQDVIDVLARDGVRLVKETIKDRVLKAFLNEHEPYMKDKVAELLEENRDKIKELLEK